MSRAFWCTRQLLSIQDFRQSSCTLPSCAYAKAVARLFRKHSVGVAKVPAVMDTPNSFFGRYASDDTNLLGLDSSNRDTSSVVTPTESGSGSGLQAWRPLAATPAGSVASANVAEFCSFFP